MENSDGSPIGGGKFSTEFHLPEEHKAPRLNIPGSGIGMRRHNRPALKGNFHDASTLLTTQMSHETEEKKESIMKEALHCIFHQLPKTLLDLDKLWNNLIKLIDQHYNSESSNKLEMYSIMHNHSVIGKGLQELSLLELPLGKNAPVQAKPIEHKKDAKTVQKLLCTSCPLHFEADHLSSHICPNSYRFPDILNLFPWGVVPSNHELIQFTTEIRTFFVDLSENFQKINLGIALMFPKTEDNEDSNLSLEVLNKLLNLTSLDYLDFFEINISKRVEIVKLVSSYPHFGEARRMLFEYDRESCFRLQTLIHDLISQCGRLYDLLVKNFDMVLKAKEHCDQSRATRTKGESDSPVLNNDFYS